MKTISTELQNHLNGEVTTLATCWRLTRRDEAVLGFTEHDHDLIVGGITYCAATGFNPSAVASSSGLQVDNMDIAGMLDSTAITEEDVLAGRYDFAEVEVFQVNYNSPESGAIQLRRGWLGEVVMRDGRFVAEMRGLTQKLTQQIGARYSAACRAELGDERCQVALEGVTETGSISSVTSRRVFIDTTRNEEDGFFASGKITFTSGANLGLAMELKEFKNGEFVCVLPFAYEVNPGDNYEVQAGCDKSFDTCVGRFGNGINFRGEPHVPGVGRMLETATTRNNNE